MVQLFSLNESSLFNLFKLVWLLTILHKLDILILIHWSSMLQSITLCENRFYYANAQLFEIALATKANQKGNIFMMKLLLHQAACLWYNYDDVFR